LCAARVPLCTPNPTFSHRSSVLGTTLKRSRSASRCRHATRISSPCVRNTSSIRFLRAEFMRAARYSCVRPWASRNSFIVLPMLSPAVDSPPTCEQSRSHQGSVPCATSTSPKRPLSPESYRRRPLRRSGASAQTRRTPPGGGGCGADVRR
jgi:hypothetical protein